MNITLSNITDEDFFQKCDKQLDLLAFNDRTFNFTTMQFQQGSPDDYLTINTGYNAPTEIVEVERKEVMGMLLKVFPQEGMLEFVLKRLAQWLSGRLFHDLIALLHGIMASNGKTGVREFLAEALGPHYFFGPNSKIFTKEQASGDSPDNAMLRTRTARALLANETGNTDTPAGTFSTNRVNNFGGGDLVEFRATHSKEPVSFNPQASCGILANKLPHFDRSETGTARRFEVWPCPSVFKDDVTVDDPVTNIYEKIPKAKFKARLKVLAPQFMRLLLDKFSPEVAPRPECVRLATEEYLSDPVDLFVSRNLEEHEGSYLFKNTLKLHRPPGMKENVWNAHMVRRLGPCIPDTTRGTKRVLNIYDGWKFKSDKKAKLE